MNLFKKKSKLLSQTIKKSMPFLLIFNIAINLTSSINVFAQNNPGQNISMVLYQVVRQSDGKQYVIAKTGQPVFVPNLNIAPNAQQLAVYQDNNGNFWYIDGQGKPEEFSHQQLGWVMSQVNPGQNSNSNPNTNQPQVQNNYYNSSSSSNDSGSSGSSGTGSALATGLVAGAAAMGGAALGTALSQPNSYYGIPYGAPLYRANNGNNSYYYVNNGQKTYVNHQTEASPVINQWNAQQPWQGRQNNNQTNFASNNNGRFNDPDNNGNNNNRRGGRFGRGKDNDNFQTNNLGNRRDNNGGGNAFGGGEGGGRFANAGNRRGSVSGGFAGERGSRRR